jgi:hypothetical protein
MVLVKVEISVEIKVKITCKIPYKKIWEYNYKLILPLSGNNVYICSRCCPGKWCSYTMYESTIFPDNNEIKIQVVSILI